MEPQNILDAAKLISAGGATIFVLVQLVKAFGYSSPRASVATAALAGALLTGVYAWSNALLAPQYAFDLVVAAVAIAATGAGINSAANATARPSARPPQ